MRFAYRRTHDFGRLGELTPDFVDGSGKLVGGHGRSALSGLLLGDVAGRILASVQTDTLFVRDGARERGAATAAG